MKPHEHRPNIARRSRSDIASRSNGSRHRSVSTNPRSSTATSRFTARSTARQIGSVTTLAPSSSTGLSRSQSGPFGSGEQSLRHAAVSWSAGSARSCDATS